MGNYCSNITIVEYDCFNSCFGLDFRDAMIQDRILYSDIQDFQEEYRYDLGDAVIHMNTIYVSKVNNNYDNLSNTNNWEIAKYFNNPKYNSLWDVGLGMYLSLKVIIQAYPHIAYQIDGKGVGKVYEDSGFRTVDKPEYYMILKSMEHTASLALKAAKMYYNNNFVTVSTSCEGNEDCYDESERIAW